jgi:hypothetical protein
MGQRELETAHHHVNDHSVARIFLDVDDPIVQSILATNSGLYRATAWIITAWFDYHVDKLLLIQVLREDDSEAAALRRHCQ